MAAVEVEAVEDVTTEAVVDSALALSEDLQVDSAGEAEAPIKVLILLVLITSPMSMELLLLPVTTVARKVISPETVRRIQTQEIRDHAKQHSRVSKIGSLSI